MKQHIKKILKRIIGIVICIVIIIIGIIVFVNWKVPHDTKDYIYNDTDSIPIRNAALILGTSRYIGNRPNLYFTYRIQAATELYKKGKVKKLVVSGDNGHDTYNEPQDMRSALMEAGIPDSIIYLDHAGFRTLDSVVRMNKIFGQKSFIIVSQKFHNERAIFLAQHLGYEVYGYNAQDLTLGRSSYRTKIRELFARVKLFIDIAIGKDPKFLGDPISICD